MISIIVPVYGSAATLAELRQRLAAVLASIDAAYEIVFVNDASPDHSKNVLAELAAQFPEVKVVTLARNVGQHRAIRVGLAHAQGDNFVVMDADLQDAPESLPLMLDKLEPPNAVVFAARSGSYHASSMDAVTSKLFKGLFIAMAGDALPEGAGLFLALNRELRDRIVTEAQGWPYLLGFIAKSGLRATSISVERQPRSVGKSAYSFSKRLKIAWHAFLYTHTPLAGKAKEPPVVIADAR
jgi:polyisoprenyl-phosphate glycosyltransferase